MIATLTVNFSFFEPKRREEKRTINQFTTFYGFSGHDFVR